MKILLNTLLFFLLAFIGQSYGWHDPDSGDKKDNSATIDFRLDCQAGIDVRDMDINNARVRLLQSGSIFWDLNNGRYIIPKVDPSTGAEEISSLFAGGVWIGGIQSGNFRVAASTYGLSSGEIDWYPGPLDPIDGSVNQTTCSNWDKHFVVDGVDIQNFLEVFEENDGNITIDQVPEGVLGWPSKGNPYFREINGFDLPFTNQGLAGFWDADFNGSYDPLMGDYPIIEIRDCNQPTFPDKMIFWIFNDNGNTHTESNGLPIRMEVQVQAFAFATNDEINNMTFYRYKMINRAPEDIDSMYFANWADPDLGCSEDDYIGCNIPNSLGFVYNQDASDGDNGCNCSTGSPTYCNDVPILGIDYFRGPLTPTVALDSIVPLDWVSPTVLIRVSEEIQLTDTTKRVLGEREFELGMSSFVYHARNGTGFPAPQTDPNDATEYYRYLSGSWRDGTPITEGGTGYDLSPNAVPTRYVFPGRPNVDGEWSMCSANIPELDPRFIQASGPFVLKPGAINELIVGVVWVPDMPDYPCPSLQPLLQADFAAQGLFDNCFDLLDGPEAPDVSIIELDQEIILTLSNPACSNNFEEQYIEEDIFADPTAGSDINYRFEGYKIFQLVDAEVGPTELDNSERARLVAQVDIRNGISDIYNWSSVSHPNPDAGQVYFPVLKVQGENLGVDHSFKVVEDLFASADRTLINNTRYYYMAIAYAYNNYSEFDVQSGTGQSDLYLEGRNSSCGRAIQTYSAIPRPIVGTDLAAEYGDGPVIRRIDGLGAGGISLQVADGTGESILDGTFDGTITYKPGVAPIEVQVFNPLVVKDGKFTLTLFDSNIEDDILGEGAQWRLLDEAGVEIITSDYPIERLNEQLIADLGISIAIQQTNEVGVQTDVDNGLISLDLAYTDDAGPEWYAAYSDGYTPLGFPTTFWDYLATSGSSESDYLLDINDIYSSWEGGLFYPYFVTNYRNSALNITPAWQDSRGENVRDRTSITELNNVDIVLTKDKTKWSRCVVLETAGVFHNSTSLGFSSEDGTRHMNLRSHLSVSQDDNDGDGLPDPDGELDENGEPLVGMSWFPGYAYNVETGKRVNIFFGENSIYSTMNFSGFGDPNLEVGGDMLLNPTVLEFIGGGVGFDPVALISGGVHIIYVTDQEYDECEALRLNFVSGGTGSTTPKRRALAEITWTSFLRPLSNMLSLNEGLIPNDVTIRLRVNNPFSVSESRTETYNGYPTYEIELSGFEAQPTVFTEESSVLDAINVVPNPYYGFSAYETGTIDNRVKITNIPDKATITIYSLDGKFIRQYDRDESEIPIDDPTSPIRSRQVLTELEWNLENFAGIPVSSGVYLIHVNAPGIGERVVKWFGVHRDFDPSGL